MEIILLLAQSLTAGQLGTAVPSTVFSTKYMKKNAKQLVILFAVLFSAFVAFRALQINDSNRLLSAVSSILRNESMTANTYALSKALSDIESLGLLDCAKVQET